MSARPGRATVGADVAQGAAGALTSGAAGVQAGTLLATGSTAAATIPVAGWVAGGVLAAGAGTVALVRGIQKRKLNKEQAVRWARSLGLPDPEEVPGFVLRLSRKDKDWRSREAAQLRRKLADNRRRQAAWKRRPGGRRTLQVLTLGIMRGPERLAAQERRLESRLALIEALDRAEAEQAAERKARRRQARTAAEAARIEAEEAAEAARVEAEEAATLPGMLAALQRPMPLVGLPWWVGALAAGALAYAVLRRQAAAGEAETDDDPAPTPQAVAARRKRYLARRNRIARVARGSR